MLTWSKEVHVPRVSSAYVVHVQHLGSLLSSKFMRI